ncbi:MAG: hypothetical protein AAFY48_18945, partial [Bacteroidota bacterium]
ALPHTFKDVPAAEGTIIQANITSEAGGSWYLVRGLDHWTLKSNVKTPPAAVVTIPIALSWVLFSKSVRPSEVMDQVIIEGDPQLARKVLDMVAVMA